MRAQSVSGEADSSSFCVSLSGPSLMTLGVMPWGRMKQEPLLRTFGEGVESMEHAWKASRRRCG